VDSADRGIAAVTTWRALSAFVLIAWGVLAFGAVYPWAFTPLFAGCMLVGLAALLRTRPAGDDLLIAGSLALLLVAIAVQLIPLPVGAIAGISAETDAALRQIRIGYPDALSSHPLSINPPETRVGLAAAAALSCLLLGLSCGMHRQDARRIVALVAGLGVAVAVIGIVQHAMWNGKIYGFWKPQHIGLSFGPFVNRNHFAGWMVMAIPLVFAYFCGRVARDMAGVKPGWRNRFMWFSSPEAGETVLIGFAVLIMSVGLTMSLSRSGLLGLVAAAGITAFVVARGRISGSRRLIVAAYASLLLFVAISWTGLDRFTSRFGDADMATMGNRIGIWQDTWRIASRFPLTGTGLNTFGDATRLYPMTDTRVHYSEAHNDYLQLTAEGGALLCIPAGVLALALAVVIRRRFRAVPHESSDYWIRVGAVTGILAIALQSLAEFSLQMPGNAVLFVLLLALAARRTSAGSAPAERRADPDMLASTPGLTR
jgi:O-antigen ligase